MSVDCRSIRPMISRMFAPCTSRLFWISSAACATSLIRKLVSLKLELSTTIAAITSSRTRSLPCSIAARSTVPPASIFSSTAAISARNSSAFASCAASTRPISSAICPSSSGEASPCPPFDRARSSTPTIMPLSTPVPSEDSTVLPALTMAPAPVVVSGETAAAHNSAYNLAGESRRLRRPPPAARSTHARTEACMRLISERSPSGTNPPMRPTIADIAANGNGNGG